jgi:hypothetical protein
MSFIQAVPRVSSKPNYTMSLRIIRCFLVHSELGHSWHNSIQVATTLNTHLISNARLSLYAFVDAFEDIVFKKFDTHNLAITLKLKFRRSD